VPPTLDPAPPDADCPPPPLPLPPSAAFPASPSGSVAPPPLDETLLFDAAISSTVAHATASSKSEANVATRTTIIEAPVSVLSPRSGRDNPWAAFYLPPGEHAPSLLFGLLELQCA
jgi:hypothetical protein